MHAFDSDTRFMLHGIRGGRVLPPNGDFVEADLGFDGPWIAAVGAIASGTCLDAQGLMVLPGIVDIHGDAFERRPMPRLRAARAPGNHVVLGAPNVIRGGSHTRAVSAADCVARGLCDVLASDCYYPTRFHAPLSLAAAGAGLEDRGEIGIGQRADLMLIDDSDRRRPRIEIVLIGGKLRHASRPVRLS